MKNIGLIVAGITLTAGLTFGGSASANHETCEEFAENSVKLIKNFGNRAVGFESAYGEVGMVSPDKYDSCIIENLEKGAPGYTIEVIKKDPEHGNGTTYKIVKKPKQI